MICNHPYGYAAIGFVDPFPAMREGTPESSPNILGPDCHAEAEAGGAGAPAVTTNCQSSLNRAVTHSTSSLGATEEMGMDTDMDEIRMILAVRALRKLLNKGDRGDRDELVASYRALGVTSGANLT